MVSIQDLEQTLAVSTLSEEEKQAWKNALPYLSEEECSELMSLLKDEREKIDALREEYAKKLEALLDASEQKPE